MARSQESIFENFYNLCRYYVFINNETFDENKIGLWSPGGLVVNISKWDFVVAEPTTQDFENITDEELNNFVKEGNLINLQNFFVNINKTDKSKNYKRIGGFSQNGKKIIAAKFLTSTEGKDFSVKFYDTKNKLMISEKQMTSEGLILDFDQTHNDGNIEIHFKSNFDIDIIGIFIYIE